jgi:hypothetical protein
VVLTENAYLNTTPIETADERWAIRGIEKADLLAKTLLLVDFHCSVLVSESKSLVSKKQ